MNFSSFIIWVLFIHSYRSYIVNSDHKLGDFLKYIIKVKNLMLNYQRVLSLPYTHHDMEPILLSISGGAGLFPAAFGACYEIDRYIKETHPTREIVYGGVSSGCITALALAYGIPEPELFNYYKKFCGYFDKLYKVPATYWYTAWRKLILGMLSKPDDYNKLNNRLFIGMTKITLSGLKFEVVSQYKSNEHVADTIICSGTLFPLSLTPFRIYEGSLACDGVLVYNYVLSVNHYNVIFKYEHLGNMFKSKDWLVSSNVDKWSRMYYQARDRIRENEHEWRQVIKGGLCTKQLIKTKSGNQLVTIFHVYRWLFGILQSKRIHLLLAIFVLYRLYKRFYR